MDASPSWIFVPFCLFFGICFAQQNHQDTTVFVGYYPVTKTSLPFTAASGDECYQLCSKSGALGQCFGATYNYNTGTCRLHLNLYEICDKNSWVRDASEQGLSVVHYSLLTCTNQRSPNSIQGAEARSLGNGTAECNVPAFRAFLNNTSGLGGTIQFAIHTELRCLVACLRDDTCWAADFNRVFNWCFFHTSFGTQITSFGVVQYQKACLPGTGPFGPITKTTTVSTSTAPTTAPTIIPPATIPDSEVCPAPFKRFDSTSQGTFDPLPATSMQLEDAINTTELCKTECLTLDAACAAATFNKMTQTCFIHSEVNMTNLNEGTEGCCVYFRKTNCNSVRECWVQSVDEMLTFPSGPSTLYVGNGAQNDTGGMPILSKVSCDGMCFTRSTTTFNGGITQPISYKLERGCDTDQPFQDNLVCPAPVETGTPPNSGSSKQEYFCADSLCNIFTRVEAANQLLHMTFDQKLEDSSLYMRDGFFFNQTRGNFTYDDFDKKKNFSGSFTGTEMVCTPFNYININPVTPEITLALWVKRTGTTPSVMGVVSKGTLNTVARTTELFKLTSTMAATDMHIYTFGIALSSTGQEFTCSTPPQMLNEWQYVIARLQVDGPPMTGTLDLFVVPDGNTTAPDTPTTSCPLVGINATLLQRGLRVNQDPLCVGGTYVNNRVTPTQGSPNYFIGLIDELRLFKNTLVDIEIAGVAPVLSLVNNVD